MKSTFQPKQKREKICTVIRENPGLNYQSLLRHTGFVNGVLSHHLKRLETEGMLRAKRKGRTVWFFPVLSDPSKDWLIINLRKETCKNILVFLLNKQAATFVEITQASRKSPATISYTLKHLVHNNVIKKIPGFQKKYSLCDPQLTKHLLDELDITPIDTMTDRFADSFSYY